MGEDEFQVQLNVVYSLVARYSEYLQCTQLANIYSSSTFLSQTIIGREGRQQSRGGRFCFPLPRKILSRLC